MISVSGVRKSFKSGEQTVAALNGIDLQVGKKEFFVLLGPSGSGKTTLMRCIAGLEKPDAGNIILDGKTVFSASPRSNVPPEERQIGMVFQSYAIWPHMTVAENIGLVLTHGPARLSQNDARERIRHALRLVQLDDFEKRPARLLSGGQQQRVALARALAINPKLLLMDEPLSNLDARLREEVRTKIKKLVSELGITVLYVTHDQVEAMVLADRIAVMAHGEILQVGNPYELYRNPKSALVAEFFGSMNWLRGKVLDKYSVETEIGRLEVDFRGETKRECRCRDQAGRYEDRCVSRNLTQPDRGNDGALDFRRRSDDLRNSGQRYTADREGHAGWQEARGQGVHLLSQGKDGRVSRYFVRIGKPPHPSLSPVAGARVKEWRPLEKKYAFVILQTINNTNEKEDLNMGTEAKTKGDVRHLDHFVLAVMDADRAEKFYTEILGARTLKRFDSPNMNRVFMKLGENHVGLFSQGKTTLPKRESAAAYPRHSFVVPESEFESTAAKIRRASPFVKEIQNEKGLGCCWNEGLVFQDSEGNFLEITKAKGINKTRLHHLHFDTTDLEASVSFYKSILNFYFSRAEKRHGRDRSAIGSARYS